MDNASHPLRLVVFDWAGTAIDFGSRAPAAAFAGVFAAHGIEVTDEEARAPMGLNKREHLLAMLNMPPIAARWQAAHGRAWTEQDVETMYAAFVPIQLDAIRQHARLVPGFLDVAAELRQRGLQLGGTTGYFRAAAEVVLQSAAAAGYDPDGNACADDVPHGRPAPWMIYRIMEQLNVYPPASVVKVGDTVADVQAGLSAGCWSVGVCDSSSVIGLSHSEFAALAPSLQAGRLGDAARTFLAAGAHATIRTIGELPALIDRIAQAGGGAVVKNLKLL